MPKNISAAVMTNQAKRLATQATLLKIRRMDGATYLITNHDTDIEYGGETYRHNVPFVLSAISTGSQLTVDNIDLSLALDEETFTLSEFKRLAFQHAEIEIMEVDFTDPDAGALTLRKGWFGPLELGQYGVARITVVGLLKLLDIEIGRVYQPSCDADLGDKRCKVAINFNQARDWRETVRVGEWRYVFNPASANEITLDNPSFEDDGDVSPGGPISGWTAIPSNAYFSVNDGGGLPDATDGSRFLMGELDGSTTQTEAHFYQDVDLIASGIDDADIDAGRISLAFFADLMQTVYLLDPVRVSCTLFDADGVVINAHDTGPMRLDDVHEVWRTKQLVFPVLEGTRSARIMLTFKKDDGLVFNGAADNVRLYWWDHIDGAPWSDVIHKVARIADLSSEFYAKYPKNSGFEHSAAAMGTSQNINGWTKGSGHPWGTDTSVLGYGSPSNGTRLIRPGDLATATEEEYELSQTVHLVNDWKFPAARIDLGFIVGELFYTVIWGDTESAAYVALEFYNEASSLISTTVLLDYETRDAQSQENLSSTFVVPVTSRSMRIVLRARSPADDSQARIGFDDVYAGAVDVRLINKQDATASTGLPDTAFSTTAGSYTFDGAILWQAHSHHVQYDEVASVVDRKQFTGTEIVGGVGAYETGQIMWISGANRGQRNLIRVWNPDTKGIKLYFESIHEIQVGDRFQYIRSCQKRFFEDCQLRYDNVINFRGFPYLPGRVTD